MSVVFCNDPTGKGSREQVGVGTIIASGNLGALMVSMLTVGLNSALATKPPVCITFIMLVAVIWSLY